MDKTTELRRYMEGILTRASREHPGRWFTTDEVVRKFRPTASEWDVKAALSALVASGAVDEHRGTYRVEVEA